MNTILDNDNDNDLDNLEPPDIYINYNYNYNSYHNSLYRGGQTSSQSKL